MWALTSSPWFLGNMIILVEFTWTLARSWKNYEGDGVRVQLMCKVKWKRENVISPGHTLERRSPLTSIRELHNDMERFWGRLLRKDIRYIVCDSIQLEGKIDKVVSKWLNACSKRVRGTKFNGFMKLVYGRVSHKLCSWVRIRDRYLPK